jgi:hypothetical protein
VSREIAITSTTAARPGTAVDKFEKSSRLGPGWSGDGLAAADIPSRPERPPLVGARLEVKAQSAVGTVAVAAAKVGRVQRHGTEVTGGDRAAWAPARAEARRRAGTPFMPANAFHLAGWITTEIDMSWLDLPESGTVLKRARPTEDRPPELAADAPQLTKPTIITPNTTTSCCRQTPFSARAMAANTRPRPFRHDGRGKRESSFLAVPQLPREEQRAAEPSTQRLQMAASTVLPFVQTSSGRTGNNRASHHAIAEVSGLAVERAARRPSPPSGGAPIELPLPWRCRIRCWPIWPAL